MQRPCFALAVLLGSMASSVLVVGRVHSQLPATASMALPSPSSTFGSVSSVSSVSVVLGQSVDVGYESWWEYSGGADHVASDDEQQRDAEASLATEDSSTTSPGWTLPTTGYDSAYDFAMHGGWYSDVAPSPTEVDYSWAEEKCNPVETGAYVENEDLTAPTGCEEDDYCFSNRFDADMGRSWVCPWSRPDSMNADCITECPDETQDIDTIATLRPEVCSRWLIQKVAGLMQWTKDTAQGWHSYAQESAAIRELDQWMAIAAMQWTKTTIRGWITYANQQPWVVQMQYRWISIASRPQEIDVSGYYGELTDSQDFDEEVLLLTAAETLDRVGSTLQEAARTLRFWAADRIVAKGNSKRVARRAH